MTGTDLVTSAVAGPVATVILNEPEARNPLSPGLVAQLTAVLAELAQNEQVRAVVLVGAGLGFSAGADLRRMRSASPLEDRDEYDRILDLTRALWHYPKPTIAAVHGFALGAGANLMNWCDIAIADEDTLIGFPEVQAGVPAATVIPTLMRTVSRKQLFDLVLSGQPVSATRAYELGLVSRVVEPGAAYARAVELAVTIAGYHPDAVGITKEIVRTVTDMSFEQAIVYAKDMRVIARLRKDFTVEIPQGARGADGASK
jgi:methylglutaconyl-CoA hydratase